MDVVITEWALDTYLDLVHNNVFSVQEYKTVIRPDAELLKQYPAPPQFQNSRFWGPATDKAGKVIPDGFKLKWHNIGPGRVQLRVSVAMLGGRAYLCRGWVKDNDATDKREAATLKRHMNVITQGRHAERGLL